MKRFKLTNVLKAVIMAAFILAILYAPGAVVAGTTTVSVSAPGSVAPGQTFAVKWGTRPW